MADKKAPAEKKDQTYINFFRNKESGRSTLMGPFKNDKGTEYFTSDFKDNQRVMIPASIVKTKKDGTGYFIQGNEEFMKRTLNVSAKGADGKYASAGTVTLADYAEYRAEANKAYSAKKLEEAKKAAEEVAQDAPEAAEMDGPEA
jgi:hypothetical protein